MSIQQTDSRVTSIPAGTWQIDASSSKLTFRVKTMWGLATVKGEFDSYTGTLRIDANDDATGELIVDVASLDTKNAKRDKHLRSVDFFDAERHPHLRFVANTISSSQADGFKLSGELWVRDRSVKLDLAVRLESAPGGRIRLQTSTSVPRAHVGFTWNKAGMITGDVFLDGEIELAPAA